MTRVQGEVPYRRLVDADQDTIGATNPLDARLRGVDSNRGAEVDVKGALNVTLGDARTAFDEVQTAQRHPVFSYQSTDELSILRDRVATTGSGAATSETSEFRVNAPGSGDTASLTTAERGRYESGFAAQIGAGMRLGSRATGATLEWGGLADANGVYFRLDDDGLKMRTKRSSTVTLDVDLADANIDPLDGTGPSGIDVADFGGIEAYLQQGHIWQITYPWYGYGPVTWAVVDQADSTALVTQGEQRVWKIHSQRIRGETSVENPNLPIRYAVEDGCDAYIGGRQFSVFGPTDVDERNIGAFRYQQPVAAASLTANTQPADADWVPLIAIRRRTDVDWAEGVRIVTDDLQVITDRKLILQSFIGPTVTGGSWGSVPYTDGSSAVQVNLTATGITFPGGTFPNQTVALDPIFAIAGTPNQSATTAVATKRTRLPIGEELIVAAVVPGSQAATVDSILDWLEIR